MDELKIAIDVCEQDIIKMQNEILLFSRNGRYPDESEFEKMIGILDQWDKTRYKIDVLKQCLYGVNINAK